MARVRLDTLLADRGLFGSRSRAAASVMAGEGLVGPQRRRIGKPGPMVADDVLIVVDVSFISLKKVLPAVLECAAEEFDCLAMVKPQFEVGREQVGKGVVRDPALRREAIDGVAAAMRELGYEIAGEAESGLPGPK